ncbi:DUF1217 domain-containing protein [Stagnihabitans tardus]|uniref:DUF1217 domain-containing protein n=1 Tax=Stagnihabitans tardus TaxID=2699202 RepID=A0AAE5BS35_9RHOB|nr:DUF1217 domain-containing protein [Stagnihabitans tardus]
MTYQPVLPLTGYAGWTLLNRTKSVQTAAFNKSPDVLRDTEYFKANIAKVKTADDLVKDRRLLRVALGAFGLDDDINNKAFIKKILADGSLTTTALANRMTDKRYLSLTQAFGFDLATPSTQVSSFGQEIVTKFLDKQFEVAVGNQDQNLRLALNAQSEVASLAASTGSDTTKWLKVIGNAALASVFQKALGIPKSVGSLDLDQQLAIYQSRAKTVFGNSSLSQFSDTTKVDSLVKRFLTRAQAEELTSQTSSTSIALTLLQTRLR